MTPATNCTNPAAVKKGAMVQFWLPMNGTPELLIGATVLAVHDQGEVPAVLDLTYATKAGPQTRDGVRFFKAAERGARRVGCWQVFVDPNRELDDDEAPAPKSKAKGKAKSK